MVIVTGGAGFIGSALVWALNRAGEERILVVDRLRDGDKWRNLAPLAFLDVVDPERFLKTVESGGLPGEARALVHLGACSKTTERDVDFLLANNVHYACSVLAAAVRRGMRTLFASSAAVYGDGAAGFSDDSGTSRRLLPLNPYGWSKLLVDRFLQREGLLERMASLRFFNVFGPNEYHKGSMRSVVLARFPQVLAEGRIELFASARPEVADGAQRRDFVYVKDVVRVLLFLLEHREACGIFNVGSGRAASFRELAEALFAALDRPLCIDYVPLPEALAGKYQYYTEADISRLRAAGYAAPFTPFAAAVGDYVRGYLLRDGARLDPRDADR